MLLNEKPKTYLVFIFEVVMVPDPRLHTSHIDAATVGVPNLHALKLQDFGLPPYPYK